MLPVNLLSSLRNEKFEKCYSFSHFLLNNLYLLRKISVIFFHFLISRMVPENLFLVRYSFSSSESMSNSVGMVPFSLFLTVK